ncbi:MAG: type II secretion system F family protein [Chloroflexi bacterium]|nr:type II secretion system F family protein [Chloroflexota bacterium]
MLTALVLTLIPVAGVALVFIGLNLVLQQPDTFRQRLEQLAPRIHSLDDVELQRPLSERVIKPIMAGIARFVTTRTPLNYVENLRQRLLIAGNPGDLDVTDFLGLQGSAALIFGVLGFLLLSQLTAVITATLVGLGLAGFGFYLPNLWLVFKIGGRRKQIQKALPDALDLLTICVEAGLGFDAALYRVTEKWDNALTQEFSRIIAEIQVGKSRRDAMKAMVSRTDSPDVAAFIAAIIQADQLGVSIARILQIQSEQLRLRRRQRAEAEAHRAPIKMLFPMIFLIFPSLFVVILGPAVPLLMESFAGR